MVEYAQDDKDGKGKNGKEKKMSAEEERKFLDKVMKRLKKALKAYGDNLSDALEDLKFLDGEQWEEAEKKRRKIRKRPMLTINMLPDKVDRVVGDMRQNRAKIKIRAVDIEADPNIALIREGIIRGIEYNSNASAVYDYAGGRMVECGYGTWRYLTRFCEDNPFVQEIYISLIKNSFAVLIDPAAKEPNKSDAKWAFILSKMAREDFEEEYPDANVPGESFNEVGEGLGKEHWWDGEKIVIAEYFEVQTEPKIICLMKDGIVISKEDAEKRIKEWEKENAKLATATATAPPILPAPAMLQGLPVNGVVPPPPTPIGLPQGVPQQAAKMGGGIAPPVSNRVPMNNPPPQVMPGPPPPPKPEILKSRDIQSTKVVQYKLTAIDIISGPNRVPGKYIPIVEITGKERDIEGETKVRGLIRDAKDPQRLVNYWNTSAAETVAMAPKAPWIGTAKQFEGYEEDYANANIDNIPFLKYNPDVKAQGPPQRNRPAEPPVAVFTQISIAEKNLNMVTGNEGLREAAPDASSRALIQRQKPVELSTFTFIDNLAQGICFGGKIMNAMIPEVYDTERDASIRMEDDTDTFVPINTTAEAAVKLLMKNPERYRGMNASKIRKAILQKGLDSKFNDIGVGKYSVIVDLGPSYATQRQESADNFVKLVQTAPELWKVAGDLVVENLDINGAQKLAARLKKTLPPRLLELKPGEQPMPPPPVPPQIQMLMAKTETEKIKQQKELLRTKVEMIRLYKETKETDKGLRDEILKVLEQLHAPEHFADSVVNSQETGTEGIGGM